MLRLPEALRAPNVSQVDQKCLGDSSRKETLPERIDQSLEGVLEHGGASSDIREWPS
jgi:hypothetical protein